MVWNTVKSKTWGKIILTDVRNLTGILWLIVLIDWFESFLLLNFGSQTPFFLNTTNRQTTDDKFCKWTQNYGVKTLERNCSPFCQHFSLFHFYFFEFFRLDKKHLQHNPIAQSCFLKPQDATKNCCFLFALLIPNCNSNSPNDVLAMREIHNGLIYKLLQDAIPELKETPTENHEYQDRNFSEMSKLFFSFFSCSNDHCLDFGEK